MFYKTPPLQPTGKCQHYPDGLSFQLALSSSWPMLENLAEQLRTATGMCRFKECGCRSLGSAPECRGMAACWLGARAHASSVPSELWVTYGLSVVYASMLFNFEASCQESF